MMTLAKTPYTYGDGRTNTIEDLEQAAASIYSSSGLEDMLGAGRDYSGWLTVEPTPGSYNYNPNNKLAKVVFYQNEPQTRYGYYAKLRIMPNGDLLSQ